MTPICTDTELVKVKEEEAQLATDVSSLELINHNDFTDNNEFLIHVKFIDQ